MTDRRSPNEEQALFGTLRATGSSSLRRRLIAEYDWLATGCAFTYARTDSRHDLEQVARIGLINAIDRFDPAYGSRFVSFARPTINGEIKRHLRDATWSIGIPRRLKDLRGPMMAVRQTLEQRLGRHPTVAEIAGSLGQQPSDVAETEHAARFRDLGSLDAFTSELAVGTPTASSEVVDVDQIIRRVEVRRAVNSLDGRERRIILWRFFEGLTQREIGERLGLSQAQVSRLLASSMAHLNRYLSGELDRGAAAGNAAQTSSSGAPDGR